MTRHVPLAAALDDLVDRAVRSDDPTTPADRREVWELIARWARYRAANSIQGDET